MQNGWAPWGGATTTRTSCTGSRACGSSLPSCLTLEGEEITFAGVPGPLGSRDRPGGIGAPLDQIRGPLGSRDRPGGIGAPLDQIRGPLGSRDRPGGIGAPLDQIRGPPGSRDRPGGRSRKAAPHVRGIGVPLDLGRSHLGWFPGTGRVRPRDAVSPASPLIPVPSSSAGAGFLQDLSRPRGRTWRPGRIQRPSGVTG